MNPVALRTSPRSPGVLVPVRFRPIGERVLYTNPWGDWVVITKEEHARLFAGEAPPPGKLHDELAAKSFLRAHVDPRKQAERVARKRRFLDSGPSLHVFVLTLRCNETCVYCRASRAEMDAVHTDMTPEIAEKAVDLALQTTSPSLTIEFQGGEPLVNFPVLEHVVEVALRKNRAYGKELAFTMVSNLALMDEEKLAFLVDHKVQVQTSIDGPEALHTKQRVLAGGNSHRESVRWIERINEAYARLGLDPLDYHVEARFTMTREALSFPREIVDTYVGLGCRSIWLRPVDPFGWAEGAANVAEADRAAYVDFYRTALDHVIEWNRRGEPVLERYASIFLTKILRDEDPSVLDVRSPSGSGIGSLAYDYDGGVFTSDEGRTMNAMGDASFKIGHVATSTYRQLVTHPTVRALVMASLREVQPDCVSCAFTPYCGVQPEHSYRTQGSIFGRMRESALCAAHKGIMDTLFEKLAVADDATLEILRRWTMARERTHFLHASSAS